MVNHQMCFYHFPSIPSGLDINSEPMILVIITCVIITSRSKNGRKIAASFTEV